MEGELDAWRANEMHGGLMRCMEGERESWRESENHGG